MSFPSFLYFYFKTSIYIIDYMPTGLCRKESIMNIENFWKLIDSVNAQVNCNDKDAVLVATKEKLISLSSSEIAAWYKIYESIHKKALRDDLWDACSKCGIHSTDDGFHYFRAWLISRGKDVFTSVLAKPDSLSVHVVNPKAANFESYGYVSWHAYSEKACKEKLGETEFNIFHNQWISENKKNIEDLTQRSSLSFEQACDRLFFYKLMDEFDILKASTDNIKTSLDTKIQSAEAQSANHSSNTNIFGKENNLEH